MEGKKIAIIGNGSTGLMARSIAILQSEHPDVEIVTLDEARELSNSKTYQITNPYAKFEFDEMPITRGDRRKKARKKRKKK